jgi:type I restriction enzyme S subunit
MNVAQLQYAIGRGVAAIRGATPADTRFIRYAIVNGLPNILALTSGSVFPNISAGDLRNFQLPWPDEKERLAIAAILGALDDKIESNRLLVQLIPQVIRAKVLAALAEHRDEVAVTALAGFVNGGAYTKGATGTGRMVIRIADLNSGPGRSTVYNDIDVPDDRTARPGDILMSWSGSLDVYRWALEEAIVNQHIFKVLPTDYPAWLVFDRLEAVIHVFQLVARDKATTMGHIQRGHLETTRVEVPTTADIARLDKALSPLWDRLLIVEQETIKLARLRDTLLPELLSGRIGAPEVAEGVEAAA